MNICLRIVSTVALAAATIAGTTSGATAQAATGRVPTVTRLVKLFTDREMDLAQRIHVGDNAGVEEIVRDDFELRTSTAPGRPIPRAEWIRQSLAAPAPASNPSQMAVHDLGDTAVVSFLDRADSGAAQIFVVDVWRRDGADWKLATRYAAPGGATGVTIPGVPPQTSDIPKRY